MSYVASNGLKTAVILRDDEASSPRDPSFQENVDNMVCWHRRHSLGDKHDFDTPHDFAVSMVEKYLDQKDVFRAMLNGELSDFRLIDDGAGENYAVESLVGLIPGKEEWQLMNWKVSREFEVVEDSDTSFDFEGDVLDDCTAGEMLRACDKYGDVAILPLYLYDHSMLSISTGCFAGRAHHAEWDSGQVGYIYIDKETATKNFALASDTIKIAKEGTFSKGITVRASGCTEFSDVMVANGYEPVNADDIKNANDHGYVASCARSGGLYKKDHKLYRINAREPDGSYQILAIATYNSVLVPLTDETWRARALECLEASVVEVDNYLQGEVYGYKLYEGLDEVDSCWGFNPGREDICDLMEDEHRGWFGGDMNFEDHYTEDFDIEDYFAENDFPELRGEIRELVENAIHATGEPWPYGYSYEDIVKNTDGVLSEVVETLYEQHEIPSAKSIHEAITGVAGESREVQMKLTVADLDPSRDYTAKELMDIFHKKASLDDVIASAESTPRESELGDQSLKLKKNFEVR